MKHGDGMFTVDDLDTCTLPFCATRDDPAPLFSTEGYIRGSFETFRLEEMRGKWLILFFYASDFTFV